MPVILFLLLNTLASLVFLAVQIRRPQRILALLFFLLPGLGFAIYFIPVIWFFITQHHRVYDESNVRLNLVQEDFAHVPDLEEEINEVSFQEAASVASSQEKRTLLMGILRKDLLQQPDLLASAMDDDDTETAHYAASASIEINRRLKNQVQEKETRHYESPTDLELLRSLIEAVKQLLDYAILSERERSFYLSKQNDLYRQLEQQGQQWLSEQDFIAWSKALQATGDRHLALAKAIEGNHRFPNEATWLNRLDMLFLLRDRQGFETTMVEFQKSQVIVSEKGLNLIRFWKERSL